MSRLGKLAGSALAWNVGFNIFRDLLQLAIMLILVRILLPEAYGKFAVVSNVIAFLAIFSQNLFLSYTLQVKEDSDTHYQDHFTAGAVLNFTLFVMTNFVALGMHWSEQFAVVAPLLHIMSLNLILDWPTQFNCRMLEREMDFRRLRILYTVGIVLSSIGSVAMALSGFGAYSLLVPTMAVTLPFLIDLFVRRGWRPTWQWSWQRYKPAWRFGVTRIGSGVMISGKQLMESSMFTAMLGFAALGLLNRSVGLAQMFCVRIASVLLDSIYPVLTRLDGGKTNAVRVGGLVLSAVGWVVIPMAAAFTVLADSIVQIIYGTKWEEVAVLLPWAMAWGANAAVQLAGYMLLLAQKHQRICLIVDALSFVGTLTCLFVALPAGTLAYLIALTCLQGLITILLLFWLTRIGAVDGRGVFMAVGPPTVATAFAVVGATILTRDLLDFRLETFVGTVFCGVLFCFLYVAVLRIVFGNRLVSLLNYFPGSNTIRRALFLRKQV